MASAERRTFYTANSFAQHFQTPQNSSESDHPSPVPKKFVSDWPSSNSINDQIKADSVRTPHYLNSDKLPGTKWWLQVNNNLGCDANYTCQNLNSCETELGSFYTEFLGGDVKSGEHQSVDEFDALSYIGSANSSVEKPCHVSPTCMKNNNNPGMQKIEALLNNDLQYTPKKKDQREFSYSDGNFMDCDTSNFLVSEKMASSDLESHLIGSEKPGPWWRSAGKDELASMLSQKSLEHIENCDLPRPQPKHFKHRYPKGVDHDKTTSSVNQKPETISLNADGYTSGTPTPGCSFQDSNNHFSSYPSKDSGPSNKDCQMNPENNSMAELLEALCHSQTRAREAEEAAQEAFNEKEHILSLFFKQASQLFAYKQWFHMLQLENLCLQLRNKNQPLISLFPSAFPRVPCRGKQHMKNHGRAEKKKTSNRRCWIREYAVALAVGLSLAGAGLLLGWTMGWMFPSS